MQGLPISVVDAIALGLLLLFFLRGLWKGFVWQVAGLVSLVGGLYAAQRMAPRLAPRLVEWFPGLAEHGGADIIVAYFAIFLGAMLAVALLAKLLKGLIDSLELGAYDRLLGGVFGLLKAAVLIILAVSVASLFTWPQLQGPVAQAYTGRIAGYAIQKGRPLFPAAIRERVHQSMQQLRAGLESPELPPPELPAPELPPPQGPRPRAPRPPARH